MCVTGCTSALWLSYGSSSCHYVYVSRGEGGRKGKGRKGRGGEGRG